MDRAGIQTGALLVVDRSLDARAGDVVAVIHRGEPMVRQLRKDGKHHQLVTVPLDGQPFAVRVEEDTIIWGVVVHVVNHLRIGAVNTARYADISDGQG